MLTSPSGWTEALITEPAICWKDCGQDTVGTVGVGVVSTGGKQLPWNIKLVMSESVASSGDR